MQQYLLIHSKYTVSTVEHNKSKKKKPSLKNIISSMVTLVKPNVPLLHMNILEFRGLNGARSPEEADSDSNVDETIQTF